MNEIAKEISTINIEEELQQSYLDYAMSVIVGRALPDVRDGLKPVHRRVLYAMSEMSNHWNKPYKKSARVVGDVIGKYHPHGDSAVYDTIVRMAQPFSLRYLLVDGQGNFGSVDGDAAAAMRYTEVRLTRIAHELLDDLDKETVDFVPNYDENEHEPLVLPAKVPNLLVNGASGIAVGMATNIPPHNLREVVSACLAVIENPEIELEELLQLIPGPDFPTAGTILGRAGIYLAYKTGRGKIYVRAKTHFEEDDKNKTSIIVTELPFQVNKARLIEKIAELVKTKRIDGITALRDESDKDGMRVVIELRRGELPDVVLNNLCKHTQLQTVFGINMVALVDGQPRQLPLKSILEAFVRHRQQVVTRRTIFDLKKARDRAHLLEGLAIALSNIDEVVALIRSAKTPAEAKEGLLSRGWKIGVVQSLLDGVEGELTRPRYLPIEFGIRNEHYHLSPQQAQAILDLRLHRLTGLEQDKIISEYKELLEHIRNLLEILGSTKRLMEVIRGELEAIKEQFGDERRTDIIAESHDLTIEDLIPEEEVVVTLSHLGYVKAHPASTYQAQHRGGKGKAAATVKSEDYVEQMLTAGSHDTVLCFSTAGKAYWLKGYQFPQVSRISKGRPIVNLLPLEENEKITAMLPVKAYEEDRYITMATKDGYVKKTSLGQFSRPRANGIIALDLPDDDRLVGASLTDGNSYIMLFTDAGKVIQFKEQDVRPMGRTARGVKGIRLQPGQSVISLIISKDGGDILTATVKGYGKRTAMSDYPLQGRSGQGVISIQVNERNGGVVGALLVDESDEVMLVTNAGKLVRIPVSEVSRVGRNTQGVTLISLSESEQVVALDRIDDLE